MAFLDYNGLQRYHNTKVLPKIEDLEGTVNGHRYGVSGIGQSASALTRLYDAIGMMAQVGTDGDNSNVVNDFDNAPPFMRRKCVGDWFLENGSPVFRVQAYLGDDDYTEDGSMGDYVAVECPISYYYFHDGVLIISDKHLSGYRPFDIFCKNHNPNDTLDYVYLPAYALAVNSQGHAVSLPNLDNAQGHYQTLVSTARTYKNGALGTFAMIEPYAVNYYEWALFTVEFATQNAQNIMNGCVGLRHNADDRVQFVDATHILTSNYQAGRVTDEFIAIVPTIVDINSPSYLATHQIVSAIRCDADGNASSSGTHQLIELLDLGKNYFTYDTTSEYRICVRPYRTGFCNSVSTPSGSPKSNSNGYYPMKYRWRENVFGNQNNTAMDLFNQRVVSGDDVSLDWYLLHDPKNYTPASSSKPDATDLATDKFTKIGTTSSDNYVDGYVKAKAQAEAYPDIMIPSETTGASATTFFCDYTYLVSAAVVRSCRFGGHWTSGAFAGFSFASAIYSPALAFAGCGADLYIQQG